MADYYSILKKTVSGLPSNTPENRKLVYGKARHAIDRQLRAINPPPGEEAIARQMDMLEQAIERMESEYGAPADLGPEFEPDFEVAAPVSAPVGRAASPAADRAPAAPPRQPGAPVSRAPDDRPPARPAAPARPDPSLDIGMSPRAPSGAAPQAERPLAGSRPPRREPAMEPPAAGSRGQMASPAYDDSFDALDEMDQDAAQAPTSRGSLPKRKRRVMPILLTLIVLVLLAGGAYAVWLNKEPLMAALGLDGSSEPAMTSNADNADTSNAAPAEDQAANDAGNKEDARLSQSGETVKAPEIPNVREAGDTSPTTPTAPSTSAPVTTSPSDSTQVSPVGGTPDTATGDGVNATDGASGTVTAEGGDTSSALPSVAQKAFLYEEGATGAGATRDNAAIVWELDEESPADGLPPEPVIRGKFDVPGRGLTMQLTIKRNVDDALPASHIIELLFETPSDFSGGNVDNVARFVMKANEQARGEGLIAVPAKIDTGYFLIALNNLAQAIETNRKLLIDSTWIDVPIGYTSGKRALVTLEKGAQGDKVFRDAFADWDTR